MDEFHRRGMETQRARGGIFAESEEHLTTEDRIERLRGRVDEAHQEKNGARHLD